MTSSLADCLNLTEAAARQQWRRIAARHTVRRQEAYLPVELILCIGLFQKVNPHQFGGANLHKLPPEVRAVVAQYQHRCAFCGFDASALRGRRLLVASHIKPWAASTNRERLDSRNGIAACAIHDSAFDTGLLTVQADLTVRRAPSLEAVLQPDTAAERLFGPDTLRTRLLVPPDAPGPRAAYLIYHARHVYRG